MLSSIFPFFYVWIKSFYTSVLWLTPAQTDTCSIHTLPVACVGVCSSCQWFYLKICSFTGAGKSISTPQDLFRSSGNVIVQWLMVCVVPACFVFSIIVSVKNISKIKSFSRSMCVALIFLAPAREAKMDSFLNSRHSRRVQEVGCQYPLLDQWRHRSEPRWRSAAEPEEEASQSTHPGGAGQLGIWCEIRLHEHEGFLASAIRAGLISGVLWLTGGRRTEQQGRNIARVPNGEDR